MAENITIHAYSRVWEQIHSAFLVLVIVAALLGNGFVCGAVYRVRRLRKVSNYFLVSLAVSDILVALFSMPFRIYFELNSGWLLGEHVCKFWIFVDLLCCSASIVNLLLISIDRYVCLSRPLRYRAIMTVRRCKIAVAVVWLFSFTISILSLHTWSKEGSFEHHPQCLKLDKEYYTVITVLGILLPLAVLIALYGLVFKMALEQQKKIYRNHGVLGNALRPRVDSQTKNDRLGDDVHRRQSAVGELKAAKTLIIVVGTFLICWLPFFVMFLLMQHSLTYIERLPPKTQEILGQLFVYTLPQLNSALNPFIYTSFNSEFRKVLKETLGKLLSFLRFKSAKHGPTISSPAHV